MKPTVLTACSTLVFVLQLVSAHGAPLFTGGDFTSAAGNLSPLCRTNGGKVSLFTERGNWNRAAKLEISSLTTNKAGEVIANASCWIGSEPDKNGFAVKPDTEYAFSVEIRGEAESAGVGFIEWSGPDTWKDMKARKSSVGTVRVQKTWIVYKGTFRTGPKAERAALHVQLFSSTAYGPLRMKAGDYVLIDNVSVEEKPARDIAVLARERGVPYAVAELPVTAPMTLPFLPEEIFAPEAEEFHVKAAVNEKKPFPLALANFTDAPAEYRVILETEGDAQAAKGDGFYRSGGKRGLAGFPSGQIEFRRAVAVRDSDSEKSTGLCLDPLPLMDEACVIQVPAKSVRLAWFDFDTAGVVPGRYRGRLRILPLSEPGKWISTGGFNRRRYEGRARDYPFTLEVLPLVLPKDPPTPAGFFQHAQNEKMFEAMLSVGIREMGISPYSFQFKRTASGTDFTKLTPGAERRIAQVRDILGWAKKRGVKLTWFIGFSAYRSLGDVLGGRKFADSREHLSQFVEWVAAVKREMNAMKIGDASYMIETWDEPEKEFVGEILAAHKALKKALPSVRLTLTLGGQGFPFEAMEKLAPCTDGWTLWDHGYFSRPDHLAFIRRAVAQGRRVSHYTCSTGASMMRGDRMRGYRRSAWMAEAYGLDLNEFFWFSDAAGGYGAQDWKTAPVAGIFYRSFDGFIPSVRAMAYREGMTDVKYLAALEAVAGDDPEVARFLGEAPMKVVRDEAHDRTAADRMRARAVELALKPRRATEGPLGEILPVPRKAVRTGGEVSGAALSDVVCVRGAVEGAPAKTADQAYRLEISAKGVKITASSPKGERYARTTLRQLVRLGGGKVPACTVEDWPSLPWRGCMFDTARNYLPVGDLKAVIDHMADYKLNLFHWHFTEDNGWRLESKKYPELGSAKAFYDPQGARHAGRIYSRDEFREVVEYAAARGVTVMPEFDVPGHSLAFRRAFGYRTMADAGVKEKIEDLFRELCSYVPAETMPFVHMGTDEVWQKHEEPVAGACAAWAAALADCGRTVVRWSPGEVYPVPGARIDMMWGSTQPTPDGSGLFDARRFYIEEYDPFEMLPASVYRDTCAWRVPDDRKLGALFCAWHDSAVGANAADFLRNQQVFPACVLFGDNFWRGRPPRPTDLGTRLPLAWDPRMNRAADLERRVVAHRDRVLSDLRYPFHFLSQTMMRWRLSTADGRLLAKDIAQATIYPWRPKFPAEAFTTERSGTLVAETWIHSPVERRSGAWIGFTAFDRDHGRARSSPLPALGKWNRFDAKAELNGEEIPPPVWGNPGRGRGKDTLVYGMSEITDTPFTNEEYYMREPTRITLRKGWNHVRLTFTLPPTLNPVLHPWVATFIPVDGSTDHPREVGGLAYSSDPMPCVDFR